MHVDIPTAICVLFAALTDRIPWLLCLLGQDVTAAGRPAPTPACRGRAEGSASQLHALMLTSYEVQVNLVKKNLSHPKKKKIWYFSPQYGSVILKLTFQKKSSLMFLR